MKVTYTQRVSDACAAYREAVLSNNVQTIYFLFLFLLYMCFHGSVILIFCCQYFFKKMNIGYIAFNTCLIRYHFWQIYIILIK